jgi:hypothetical protein
MRPATVATCFWPGLAALWWRGRWIGLLEATLFTAALNFLLVATFVWPEWFGKPWPMLGWMGVGTFWVLACWRSLAELPALLDGKPDAMSEALFSQAQTEYLKGNWYDAERLASQLLARRPRDAEGRLLLVSILRHAGRNQEAARVLTELERLDGARRWMLEIGSERRQLENGRNEEGPR